MKSAEIQKRLKNLPGWHYTARGKSIRTERKARHFMDAVRLIGRIARLAEAMDHHPDLHLTRYRKLTIVSTTHDAGGVTRKDFALARKISRLR